MAGAIPALVKECNVCFEVYNNTDHLPKLLKCGHDLCTTCLHDFHEQYNSVNCPVCNTEYKQEPDDSDAYITAFSLIRENNNILQNTSSKICNYQKCSSEDQVQFCKHCDRYLCKEHYLIDKESLISDTKPVTNTAKDILEKWKDLNVEIQAIKELENRNEILDKMVFVLQQLKTATNHKIEKVEELKEEKIFVAQKISNDTERLDTGVTANAKSNIIYGLLKRLKLTLQEFEDVPEIASVPFQLKTETLEKEFRKILQLFEQNITHSYRLLPGMDNILHKSNQYEACWVINNATDVINQGKCFVSPDIYTSFFGYKVKLYLECLNKKVPDYLGLYIAICRSKHDDVLQWPFPHVITFYFLNRKDLEDSTKYVLSYDRLCVNYASNFQKPKDTKNNSLGYSEFLEKEVSKSADYLKDDQLEIKIKLDLAKDCAIEIPHFILSYSEDNYFSFKDKAIVWKISNISIKVNFALWSPKFLLSHSKKQVGYEMILKCLPKNFVDENEAVDKYMSLYLTILKGQFDEVVNWPCKIKFRMELMNVQNPTTIGPNTEFSYFTAAAECKNSFQRPKSSEGNSGVGQSKLISSDRVFGSQRKKYVDNNDNLYIRLSVL